MIDSTGLIFDIRRFSIHDGPGIRTTVFFKGCPLSCWWCHNPESQYAGQEVMLWDQRCIRCDACIPNCPLNAISRDDGHVVTNREECIVCTSCMEACTSDAREVVGRFLSADQVMAEIVRDLPFYEESGGGVTFSGGEPLIQRRFLTELLQRCKDLEIHTALDTSGYTPWTVLDAVRGLVDLFLYDIKLIDDARHLRYTGVHNALILRNLEALSARGHRIIVRVPVIPGINDDEENLSRIAAFAAGLSSVERVDLLPYHPSAAGKYERLDKINPMPQNTQTPSDARMVEIAGMMQAHQLSVQVGG